MSDEAKKTTKVRKAGPVAGVDVVPVAGRVPEPPEGARRSRYPWDTLTEPGCSFLLKGAKERRGLVVPKRLGFKVTQEVKTSPWRDSEGNEYPAGVVVRRK